MSQFVVLHTALVAEGVPEWVHLVPAGTFSGQDGRGPYRVANAARLIEVSMQSAGGKILVDENHSTELAPAQGEPSPARGWIVALDARADGIWGRVEWTPTGAQLMTEKAYRGISPVFAANKSGQVVKLLSAALTNKPNLTLTHLHTKQETGMDLVTQLRTALGLTDAADEAAILARVRDNAGAVATHAQQLTAISTAAGVTASSADGLVTVLNARAKETGDVASMRATVVSLQTQLQTLEVAGKREKAVAYVDAAIKAGKPINPLRDHYIERHVADAAAVEKELAAMVSIHTGGFAAGRPSGQQEPDGDEPTETERMVAQQFGQDVKKLVAQRKSRTTADGRAA